MIRFCATILVFIFLGFQWVFSAIGGEDTSHLIDRLKGMNFHEMRIEAPANNMRFTTIKGDTIDLLQLEGKLVILSFWTVETPQWSSQMRCLEKLQSKYRNDGLEIVALNLLDPIEKIKAFLNANPTNVQVAFDPYDSLSVNRRKFSGDVSTVFVTDRNSVAIYEIPEYPTTYLIDKNGRALGFFVGTTNWDSIGLENVILSLLKAKRVELAEAHGQFQTDARQGLTSPPQAPVIGGPTKRGPVQAPLGPQAPIPVPDMEAPKMDVKSLPFQSPRESSATQPKQEKTTGPETKTKIKRSPSSNQDTGSAVSKPRTPKRLGTTKPATGEARIRRTPTSHKAPASDPFVSSGGRQALPLARSKALLHQKPSSKEEAAVKTPGLLPAAKPYYPQGKGPVPVELDSPGKTPANVPGLGNRASGQYSGYPPSGASDLPAAQPLTERNLIGGSILDSFGINQKAESQVQPLQPNRAPSENQPNNVFQQFGQDLLSLGEGIRGAFSKISGSR
jgi:peroxiredoxin